MSFDNMPGTFGSDSNRENTGSNNTRGRRNSSPAYMRNNGGISELSPERIVDIVCLSVIGLFLLIVACTWTEFSNALFEFVLFPIINIGSKIVAGIAAIGTGIGLLCARFGRRRRW